MKRNVRTDVSVDHPKQRLLFFAVDSTGPGVRNELELFIADLSQLRDWINGPPQFVDSTDIPETGNPDDIPNDTIGGVLEIYTALPPWKLPRDLDEQHYAEVSLLVSQLCEFSKRCDLAFDLELDGDFVGRISSGNPDESLQEGLLGEWRRYLDSPD